MLKFFHEAPRHCRSFSFTTFLLISHVLTFLSHLSVNIFLQAILFISFHASIGSNNTTKFPRLILFPVKHKTLFQMFGHFSLFDDHFH